MPSQNALNSNPQANRPWPAKAWALALSGLTLATFLIHGYHPLAEDGGLYVAGVEYLLNPRLFAHYTAFVSEHLRFSFFAPAISVFVHATHISLPWTLLLLNLFSIALTLYAGLRILRQAIPNQPLAQLAGIALLAAWWTLPVAGTSLMLMDPYVTARSLSTPFSLLAISFALLPTRRNLFACALCLIAAASFHPLMAAYAVAFIIVLQTTLPNRPLETRISLWLALTLSAFAVAALVQYLAPPEPPALVAATITRYYWFLSRWRWFELLGLAGPPAMLSLLLIFRRKHLSLAEVSLCQASLVLGGIAVLTALLFAHETYATHLVARLQVLRIYLLLYALMTLLLGATLYQLCEKRARIIAPITLATMALLMFYVQRQTYPASIHIELPGRTNPNPWVRAFLWAKANTPTDALFALDAKYINEDGEDAQTFRAIALRSAIPDYSKDGGEASITPALAPTWHLAATAQKDLSNQSDAVRDANLQPFGVTWMLLHSSASTRHLCPYNNGTVKVCRVTP